MYILDVTLEFQEVVPGRLELPTSTLSVWRSNQLSYRTVNPFGCCVQATRACSARLPFSLISINSSVSTRRKRTKLQVLSYYIIHCWKIVSRKEVFQPHLPVRLPCYDLAPITSFSLGRSLRSRTSGSPGFHGLAGGVYKARERIHRAMADARLLANPASWGRVADPSPNCGSLSGFASACAVAA